MKISKSLAVNTERLKNILDSDDITFLSLKLGKATANLIFVNDLINKDTVGSLILRPASVFKGKPNDKIINIFIKSVDSKNYFYYN